MAVDPTRRLLQDLLDVVIQEGGYPEIQRFRVSHEKDRKTIDDMAESHLIVRTGDRYGLTLEGLRRCGSKDARRELERVVGLLAALQDAYRRSPSQRLTTTDMAQQTGQTEPEVGRALTFLQELSIWSSSGLDSKTGLVNEMKLVEGVLDVSPSDVLPPLDEEEFGSSTSSAQLDRLEMIAIDGYRPFSHFTAELGSLTVVIGANASGKTSLLDFLRFIRHAVEAPLPPEIDERSAGRALFHIGGAERIAFSLTLDTGRRLPLSYEAEILGPIGSPRVARERLTTTKPLLKGETRPFIFLEFTGGRGVVRDQRERRLVRPEWTVQPNELALRRALDPTLLTLSHVQRLLSSWSFYSGFDVHTGTGMRRPVPSEPAPILREDGANLSAVLNWLKADHQDIWVDLESHVRAAVPGFISLGASPRGGPGTVIGTWREEGVKGELTLADLSDGTLRFLCLAVLCLSPNPPPLLCIDEPELGLHPRVLPRLAGLFKAAASRTQILITTHSPYFLSQFDLQDIAVMRKERGATHFVRPKSSKALRTMVDEIGSDALFRLHVSDELETLP